MNPGPRIFGLNKNFKIKYFNFDWVQVPKKDMLIHKSNLRISKNVNIKIQKHLQKYFIIVCVYSHHWNSEFCGFPRKNRGKTRNPLFQWYVINTSTLILGLQLAPSLGPERLWDTNRRPRDQTWAQAGSFAKKKI